MARAHRLRPGEYHYRGYLIERCEMYGFWRITAPDAKEPEDATDTLRDAKRWIDGLVSAAAPQGQGRGE